MARRAEPVVDPRAGAWVEIYVCLADGRGLKPVVTGASNENPHWSPDGRHLVFASNREGENALFVSDLDDQPPRRLNTGALHASSPAWSPLPAAPNSP